MIRTALATMLLAAAFAAQAEGPTEPLFPETVGNMARATVAAELQRALAEGAVWHGEVSHQRAPRGRPLSRVEVCAQLDEARAQGWMDFGEAAPTQAAASHPANPDRLAGLGHPVHGR